MGLSFSSSASYGPAFAVLWSGLLPVSAFKQRASLGDVIKNKPARVSPPVARLS